MFPGFPCNVSAVCKHWLHCEEFPESEVLEPGGDDDEDEGVIV